jgi:hypothetical protein
MASQDGIPEEEKHEYKMTGKNFSINTNTFIL